MTGRTQVYVVTQANRRSCEGQCTTLVYDCTVNARRWLCGLCGRDLRSLGAAARRSQAALRSPFCRIATRSRPCPAHARVRACVLRGGRARLYATPSAPLFFRLLANFLCAAKRSGWSSIATSHAPNGQEPVPSCRRSAPSGAGMALCVSPCSSKKQLRVGSWAGSAQGSFPSALPWMAPSLCAGPSHTGQMR